jgi:CRP-like cAMP-binding protein
MNQEWLEVLAETPLFQGIAAADLGSVIECLKPELRHYQKNEALAIAGDPFLGVGILLAGQAEIVKENAAGNRSIMALLVPGELFGEMAAFSGFNQWPASVIAQEKSIACFLAPGRIVGTCERTCASHHALVLNMLRIISEKALMLNRKIEYLTIPSLRGKICAFLLEQQRRTGGQTFMLPMNRNELADFLNVSRPSLSRELGRMRDEGLIEFHRASLRIKDVERVRGMVD